MSRFVSLIAAGLLILFSVPSVHAEVRTRHFRFVPDTGSVGLARRLADRAEMDRSRVQELLGINDDRVIEVRIASDDAEMKKMTGSGHEVSDWIAGLAMSGRDLIVLSNRGNEVFKVSDTFVHELAHVYLHSALNGRRVPRWFNEGFAMLVASEQVGERLKTAMGAAATGSYIPLDDLTESFPARPPAVHLAYSQSMLFLRYLYRQEGHQGIASLISEVREGMLFDLAFARVFGGSVSKLWDRFESTLDWSSALLWVLSSTAVLWILVTLLFLYVYVVKKRRTALKKQAWAIQEEIDRIHTEAVKRGIDPYEVQ